jgi:hypothetical protein
MYILKICLEPFTDINERCNVLLVDTNFQNIHEAHSSNFHEPCILQWMEEKDPPTCPFCRKILKRNEEPLAKRLRRKCKTYLKLFRNCCLCSVLNPILWITLYYRTSSELKNECPPDYKNYDSHCYHISNLNRAASIILLIELILVCSFRQRES